MANLQKNSMNYAADQLGIQRMIPGFLDPTLKLGQLRKGVSFASAGSGFDDVTANTLVRIE